MYRLRGADAGNHSLSMDTSRSMPLSSTSGSISGRPTRTADVFNRCKFNSGRNRFMWPCTDLYAFIPSKTCAASGKKTVSINTQLRPVDLRRTPPPPRSMGMRSMAHNPTRLTPYNIHAYLIIFILVVFLT